MGLGVRAGVGVGVRLGVRVGVRVGEYDGGGGGGCAYFGMGERGKYFEIVGCGLPACLLAK